jgi:dTMP kinase
MTQGKLIIIEGGEGSGKSTLLRSLREIFPDAVFTREPGGSTDAEKIRTLIFDCPGFTAETQFMLFWAARLDHIENVIKPALITGQTVITDRFDLSTFAYQLRGKGGSQELVDLFWQFRDMFLLPVLHPENMCYIYLDIDPVVGLRRVDSRGGDATHFDQMSLEFHRRVLAGGHEFLENIKGTGSIIHIIDAAQSASDVLKNAAEIIGGTAISK